MPQYPYNSDMGQTDLMAAAYHGDLGAVAAILSTPCDIDAQDHHGMTALMYAAMEGHSEVVGRLIDHEADMEIQSAQRYTALMYAVRGGHVSSVHRFLGAKADPDVRKEHDTTFETPLTLAARCGNLPIVRALVGAGANVSLRGGIWQLPAEAVARREGHHDISEFLLYYEKRPVE